MSFAQIAAKAINGGGGGSGDSKFVGNVTNGSSWPTTRLDGTALKEGDYVRPKATSSFPFVIGSVTFTSARDKAVYSTAGWMLDPGALQDTIETPTKDKVAESISETATTQYSVNVENKAAINSKVSRDTSGADVVYSRINNADSNQPISKSAVANTVAWRGADGTLKVGNAVNAKDAVNKETADASLATKIDKIDTPISIENAVVKKADGTYGLMQVNINANAGLAIVRRDLDKQINVPLAPLADDDAASKKYVDDNKTIVDNALSDTSENPVQNKVINAAHSTEVSARQQGDADIMVEVDKKQDKLTADANITIGTDNKISSNQVDDSLSTSATKTYSIDKIKEEIRIAGATFRGTFATKAALDAYSGTKEKNDRANVTKDETQSDATTLYSWNGTAWVFEYVISTKPIELDQTSIDYDANGKLSVKAEGIGFDKLAKHTSDVGKSYVIQSDGTTGLENIRNYKDVVHFGTISGNNYTMYNLTAPCVIGTKTYEIGLYTWSSTDGFKLVANSGAGGSSTPIFVGEVSPGDVFPATRPDSSALVAGDYVRPYAGSTFPFTIGTVTFTNVRDTAVYMSAGNWLLNASVYQKTNETPINNKASESVKGNTSLANFQADINAENVAEFAKKVELWKFPTITDFPATGNINYVYCATDTNYLYRWDNTKYVLIGGCNEVQVETMPAAVAEKVGKVVQFIGTTTTNYTNGYFYKCINDSGTYKWIHLITQDDKFVPQLDTFPAATETSPDSFQYIGDEGYDKYELYKKYISVYSVTFTDGFEQVLYTQTPPPETGWGDLYNDEECTLINSHYKCHDNGAQVQVKHQVTEDVFNANLAGGSGYEKVYTQPDPIQVSTMPTAGAEFVDRVLQFIGTTTTDYTNGYFYKCVNDAGTYKWVNIKVQEYKDEFVPQLTTFPTASETSPTSFQYIGTDSTYSIGSVYLKGQVMENITWPIEAGTKTAYVKKLPISGEYETLYGDSACTVVMESWKLFNDNGTYKAYDVVVHNFTVATVHYTYAYSRCTTKPEETNKVTYSSTAPSNPKDGDLWVDPSDVSNTYSRTESDARYLQLTGGNITGSLSVNNKSVVTKSAAVPTFTMRSGWKLVGNSTCAIGDNTYYLNITVYNDSGQTLGSNDCHVADVEGYPWDCTFATCCYEAPSAVIGCVMQTKILKLRTNGAIIPAGAYIPISGILIWAPPSNEKEEE